MPIKSIVVPQVLQITADGTFRVRRAGSVAFRCGPKHSSREVSYKVVIRSRPDLLDGRGFIIDWQDILREVGAHFDTVKDYPPCEGFATEICGLVANMLNNRCVSITVDVGAPGLPAAMRAEYIPDPVTFQRKTDWQGPTPDPDVPDFGDGSAYHFGADN